MAKIKLENGKVLNFEGDPTLKDIEEALAQVGERNVASIGSKSFFRPGQLLTSIAETAKEEVSGAAQQIQEAEQRRQRGEQGILRTGFTAIAQGAQAGLGTVVRGALDIGSALLPDFIEDPIRRKTGELFDEFISSPAGTKLLKTTGKISEAFNLLEPKNQQLVKDFTDSAMTILDVGGFAGGKRIAETGIKKVGSKISQQFERFNRFSDLPRTAKELTGQIDEVLKGGTKIISTDIDKIGKQINNLVEQGKLAEARGLAEEASAKITFKESLAGLRPDIKNRIKGKQELMKEYIDVVVTRNINDTAPSIFEYGGNFARKAADTMESLINDSGSKIGKTRKKLGTIESSIDDIKLIENEFIKELNKINLELKNGIIRQKPGTVTLTGGGDIRVLNDLYNKNIKILKQNPDLTNLIDSRFSFDSKIKFEKSAREASNAIDPLSRQVRRKIADTAAKTVGKSEAAELKRFSDFMEAFNEIKSFTDRRAGGEFLLRLVLSGRGGEARQIVQTIKDFTGIDLLDHATMMQVANEMLGNPAQKNLFRQELTKAGFDVASLLSGKPGGVFLTLFEKGIDKIIDPEKILLEAAR